MKNISFLPENFQFLEVKFSIYLNRHVFVMIFKLYDTCNTPFTAHSLQRPLRQTGQIPTSQLTVILSGSAVLNKHNLSHGKLLRGRNMRVLWFI